jgi:hypothetical protein
MPSALSVAQFETDLPIQSVVPSGDLGIFRPMAYHFLSQEFRDASPPTPVL